MLQAYEPVEEGSYIKMIDMVSGHGGQIQVSMASPLLSKMIRIQSLWCYIYFIVLVELIIVFPVNCACNPTFLFTCSFLFSLG